ncbi:glycoprotein Xg isoform X16 [Bubalus bubalis]|uniref:glycoprotein Xg isoform X16 n=1 Tax=Bubalus bubalis TaxID=89462 RepID=UPI001E1B97F5|nr:glycoprotein Xg isoform X16 [Bubalus bubalis]
MEAWRGLFCLTLLCVLLHVRGENGDFDLADALDDPKPTKKPSSGIYPNPRPPYQPQPGNPNNGGNIYPRTKPLPPRPQPGNSGGFLSDSDLIDGSRYPPRPPAGGGGGGFQPGHDGYGRGGRNIPGSPGINYGGGGGGFQPGHDGYGVQVLTPHPSIQETRHRAPGCKLIRQRTAQELRILCVDSTSFQERKEFTLGVRNSILVSTDLFSKRGVDLEISRGSLVL